jgi:hypothetical protein
MLNLNARAIGFRKSTSTQINTEVTALTQSVDASMQEADKLIASLHAPDLRSNGFLRLIVWIRIPYSAVEHYEEHSAMDTEVRSSRSKFKSPFFYARIALLIVFVYVVFLLVSRYESNRAYERRNAEKAAEQQRETDRAAIEQLGGRDLAIRALYISPPIIKAGQTAQLCYDVANASSVTLDPPAGGVWPSHNRCVDVSPKKTTSYTLTITGSAGNSVAQSVELKVH